MPLDANDRWVGEVISRARIAYETLTDLMGGKIKIEPEFSPDHLAGSYLGLFTNYTKTAFLASVAALHRGFFKMEKGALVRKKVACRMLEFVSEAQMNELMKLTAPLHTLRDWDQHREGSGNPPVWTRQVDQGAPTIGPFSGIHEDPSALYTLLRSLEPTIGYAAFLHAAPKRAKAESK